MTRRRPGDCYGLPLADGRWGIARVVATNVVIGGRGSLIASTRWIGSKAQVDAKAALRDPRVHELLVKSHHAWPDELDVYSTGSTHKRPAMVRLLGNVPLSPEEMRLVQPLLEAPPYCSSAPWPFMATQMLLQWRWENDRNALLAEEDAQRRAEEEVERLRTLAPPAPIPEVTLQTLRKVRFFASWSRIQPRTVVEAARRIVWNTIEVLQDGEQTPKRALPILADAARAFTKIKGPAPIGYDERVDFVDALNDVAELCGVGDRTFRARVRRLVPPL